MLNESERYRVTTHGLFGVIGNNGFPGLPIFRKYGWETSFPVFSTLRKHGKETIFLDLPAPKNVPKIN
jgi:hypothetical protein